MRNAVLPVLLDKRDRIVVAGDEMSDVQVGLEPFSDRLLLDLVVRTSGLILVEGAVPGNNGGWITVRDAVKKPLPKEVPKPGKFRLAEAAPAAEVKEGA